MCPKYKTKRKGFIYSNITLFSTSEQGIFPMKIPVRSNQCMLPLGIDEVLEI